MHPKQDTTGNNFTILGDVCRRAITTNMDPEVERPELRQFGFDPVERVLTNRGQYIAAALTICRAYFAAGRPDKVKRLASFEGWSDTVRSALIWLGKEDPVKSMESARAEDPERIELSDMLEAWGAVIGIGSGSRMRLAGVLAKGLGTSRQAEGSDMEPTYPDLHAALLNVAQRSAGRTGRSAPPDFEDVREVASTVQGQDRERQALYGPVRRKTRLGMVGRTGLGRGVEGVSGVNFQPSCAICQ